MAALKYEILFNKRKEIIIMIYYFVLIEVINTLGF